jgi:hypothetical protein
VRNRKPTQGTSASAAVTKLVNRWPAARIDELMPWAYAKATSDPVNV